MRRSLGEISRRGLENVIANWPLILIRIVEGVATLTAAITLLAAAVTPVVVAGLGTASLTDVLGNPAELERLLAGVSPLLVLYLFVVISVIVLVALLIHSWVQGGVVGCYLAGDRRAPEGRFGRGDFEVFTPELWWREARRLGWRFFWIYNVVWGAYSLVLLAPLLLLLVAVVILHESPAAAVVGCAGIGGLTLAAILLGIATFVWSQVVLIECARTDGGVFASIRRSYTALRERAFPIMMVAAIFFGLSIAVGSAVAGMAFGMGAAGAVPGLEIAFFPLRIVMSLFNSLVSTLFSSWLIAGMVAALMPAEDSHGATSGV